MPQIPIALLWTIPEDELSPLKDSINKFLVSDSVLNIPGFEYYLDISPNGDDNKDIGETVICLYLKLKDLEKVEADFTITIESANYTKNRHRVYDKSCGWPNYICSTKEFFDPEKKYIVDGKFTVKIDGIFKSETDGPAVIDQKWDGGELGDQLWKKESTKDFTIITSDGNELKVHKNVLDCRSDVFSAMLNSNMKESIENKVNITDFSFNVVETAVKIIYDCNFISSLSLDELMELLRFLDKYQLPKLKAKIEPLLIARISQTTVVRLTNGSVQTNSFKLKERCMEFLWLCIKRQTPMADIDDLDKDVLLEIVKNSLYRIVQTEK